MKKTIAMLCSIVIAFNFTCAGAAERYTYFSAAGRMSNKLGDVVLSSHAATGGVVLADASLFNKIISSSNMVKYNEYTCYGSDNSPETLTLGVARNDFTNPSYRQCLQICVNNQIAYIQSIGGIMTGYTFESDGGRLNGEALNISWDVGETHHFARFELSEYNRIAVGYYDLMYTSNSTVQNDIPYMNNSFIVRYGDQSD